MKTYARMRGGFAVEIIEPVTDATGKEIHISKRFHPDFIAQLVPYDPDNPPEPPAPDPAPIPASVTMLQARTVLILAGHVPAIDAAIDAMGSPERELTRAAWEFAATIDRASPFVAAVGAMLDLDEAAIDALFIQAVTL